MKIKSDFITNSSSSSFVVAIKGDLTIQNIAKYYRQEILDFIRDTDLDYYYDDFVEEIKNESDEENIVLIFAREILKLFKENYNSMMIDDWKVTVHTASSEDGEIISNFFYCGGNIKKDNLIVHGGFS